MLQYVVSVNRHDYESFKCVQSLQNIEWEKVDALIYHN